MAPPPLSLDLSTKHATAINCFSYTPSMAPPPINQLHTWTIRVTTPEGQPVEGATIAVDGSSKFPPPYATLHIAVHAWTPGSSPPYERCSSTTTPAPPAPAGHIKLKPLNLSDVELRQIGEFVNCRILVNNECGMRERSRVEQGPDGGNAAIHQVVPLGDWCGLSISTGLKVVPDADAVTVDELSQTTDLEPARSFGTDHDRYTRSR